MLSFIVFLTKRLNMNLGELLKCFSKDEVFAAVFKYKSSFFKLHPARPDLTLAMAEKTNMPQEMQFAIDCLPAIQKLLSNKNRTDVVEFLDFGPGFGAGANLFATLYQSDFLQCRLIVDALDHKDLRKELADVYFPLVNYIVGDINSVPDDKNWDVIYCSNVLEHLDNPKLLIDILRKKCREWLVIYVPYKESPLSPGHLVSLDETVFQDYNPIHVEVKSSVAWQPAYCAEKKQLLVILPGMASQ